ncbi:MAG: glycoside hydrolase family 99-like domain-containing protein [Muribaculaceae bacterium]|nr:glycoside hydrolase family 99-like domain-containing protein [Muribaculaceae bacterium]
MIMKTKIIAFYLPQFHSFKENDEWWGKGFTEWTNVGKAKSYFKGHDQPRVPTELGYYNLKDPEVRETQAQLAKESGISGFMYWHYWFGRGRQLMNDIFDSVLESGRPDFPFCLGWANHSWFSKQWNKDGTSANKMLIDQDYPGEEDILQHFSYLLKAFNDKRYIKIGNKPLFVIYDPSSLPKEYLDRFQILAKEAGFDGIFTVCYLGRPELDKDDFITKGFDMVMYQRLDKELSPMLKKLGKLGKIVKHTKKYLHGLFHCVTPYAMDYKEVFPNFITDKEKADDVAPIIIPQWDHSPRSGRNGIILYNSEPEFFRQHTIDALNAIKDKPEDRRIIFLKSWNEWGEGNYMEPDITHGRGFIEALRGAIDEFENKQTLLR